MAVIIDRRKNSKGKNTGNRQKFIRRVKEQVKDAVRDAIREGDVSDIIGKKGKNVNIPGKGLDKPEFHHDPNGGVSERVLPGNEEFEEGDRVPRPDDGAGGAGHAGSPDGDGDDDFFFQLTQEEFLDIFFEDLELPDLKDKAFVKTQQFKNQRAGFSVSGTPNRLNILRSMKQAKGRKIGLTSINKKKLKKAIAELEEVSNTIPIDHDRVAELTELIAGLKRKIAAVPFIDDMDLRYNQWTKVPIPATQAVMFGIMDVSISMGEWEKEMAKRFYMLLLLFLSRNYERVDIVWIRHHSVAKEVDEEEFFYSKATGGTIVSSALELMSDIIKKRYPRDQWNIYGCQVSDGDNWPTDNDLACEVLSKDILPLSQYFAYVEVDAYGDNNSDLWPHYTGVKADHDNFEMSVIADVSEIYPMFRKLFEKHTT